MSRVLGLVACAAGGVDRLRAELVEPLVADGWTVGITLTATAARWLEPELPALEELTGLPVRWTSRLPAEPRPHPDPTCFAVVPATANYTAKLALGISDSQALTPVCEALGGAVPVVLAPRVNALNAGHPAWPAHLAALRSAGVHLLYEVGAAIPWSDARTTINRLGRSTGRTDGRPGPGGR